MAPRIGDAWQAQLMELRPNWDSHKAPEISREAIATLGDFYAVPCSDGGIQLEAHRDGFDIEIEISPAGKIKSALICRQDKR